MLTLRHRPAKPPTGPSTLDLGPEPPAIVNFLTHGFRVTPDAVPATLLDLAARGVVTLEHRGPDTFVCRLGTRPEPEGLTEYERRVMSLLQDRVRDGIVPPQALTSGPEQKAAGWRKAFDDSVVADAQQRGLSTPIVDGVLLFSLVVGSVAAAVLWWQAAESGLAGIAFVVASLFVLGGVVPRDSQRETAAGLAAASRWLGVRAALHEDEVFATLPPITVGMWKRYLAYGAALGVAPGAVRPIPMGAESDSRAWSSYGGRWRAVRVEYPSLFPIGWGQHPLLALLRGAVIGVVSGFLLYAVAGPLAGGLSSLAFAAPFLVVPAMAALVALFLLFRSLADLPTSPVVVRGEILRLRVLDERKKRYYYAC